MARQNIQFAPGYQNAPQLPTPLQPQLLPPVPRRRRSFRWEFVLVPLAILCAVWLINHLPGPTFSWSDVTEALHVSRRGESRYTQTAVMGLVLIAVVYVLKTWRSKP
jgi:hypothetical protein